MLYLVPTPIGNLSDISDRIRQVLSEADFIPPAMPMTAMLLSRMLSTYSERVKPNTSHS